MPIKDASIYPKYWKQFSAYIRFERAGGKCEVCGVENYTERDGSKIVLTVAHLDAEGDVCRCFDDAGFLCANPDHVKAMCQRDHNRYDRPKRNKNARLTAQTKADAARGLFI